MNPDPAALAGRPVIVGAGLAGLIAALRLAPRPVVVLNKAVLGEGAASGWSQGGLAAAVMPDDSPARHAADTLEAGDGLNDSDVVRHMTEQGAAAVALLEEWGVRFARDAAGAFACKLEAAHTRRRVLNAGGDGTGAEIMRALIRKVRETLSITLVEAATAETILLDNAGVAGITASRDGERFTLATRDLVIATGGAGGLWANTTNPIGALGQGLALAARAGAALVDLEFVQFHPTALDVGRDPMPLASEAIRGEGATLIDEIGRRFMRRFARAELEPRDIVSRAVWAELVAGHSVFLDTRAVLGADLPRRFPTIAAACRAAGIDPVNEPMPIRPAAHYHMGGIAVDAAGRSTIEGLWACGEAASTGLHGANRLASNSLLEAVVTGCDVAAGIAGRSAPAPRAISTMAAIPGVTANLPAIRHLMSEHVGVLRDAVGLRIAIAGLLPFARDGNGAATAALTIAVAALRRTESRGGHARTDHPATDAVQAVRRHLTWREALATASEIGAA
jgi:L-aspartate oxidase